LRRPSFVIQKHKRVERGNALLREQDRDDGKKKELDQIGPLITKFPLGEASGSRFGVYGE